VVVTETASNHRLALARVRDLRGWYLPFNLVIHVTGLTGQNGAFPQSPNRLSGTSPIRMSHPI
jgi:hypothetical protein